MNVAIPDATSSRRALSCLAAYCVGLIAAWIGAWYLHDLTAIRDLSPRDTLAYWTLAKVILWSVTVHFLNNAYYAFVR